MITKALKNFNIRQIADSGQCFRMVPCDPNRSQTAYRVISGRHFLIIEQHGDEVTFHCPNDEFAFWEHYFDLETDYDAYIRAIDPMDDYLSKAAAFGNGIRILNQDLWEMIITFIISQQKTIPAIRALVEALSEKYGTRHKIPPTVSGYYYAFPTPEELNRASLDDLLALKLGYRAKYIHRLIQDVLAGTVSLESLAALPPDEAMTALTSLYGIGPKVANCVCLFGLHHIDAFPVDTWIEQILTKEYLPKHPIRYRRLPKSRLYTTIIQDFFGSYKGYAGVMQQYIFY